MKRLSLTLATVAAVAVLVAPVGAARTASVTSVPESGAPTALGLKAYGLRLQAIAAAYTASRHSVEASRSLASAVPTKRGLAAYGLRLQAIARAYQHR